MCHTAAAGSSTRGICSIELQCIIMNDTDIDIYHLKCCAASSTTKCGGTTYHDSSGPRGTTCGNTSSPGGLPMVTYVVRGDH